MHLLYNYQRTCHFSSPKFELHKIVWPGRWKKKCQIPAKPFWGSPILSEIWGIWHFFCLFLTLWNVGNSILFPKLYIRPLSQPNYLPYLESHLVRNVEITPKPVWALYWVTAPCFIEKNLILAVLLSDRHNENHFIHDLIFHHIFFRISRIISLISQNQSISIKKMFKFS